MPVDKFEPSVKEHPTKPEHGWYVSGKNARYPDEILHLRDDGTWHQCMSIGPHETFGGTYFKTRQEAERLLMKWKARRHNDRRHHADHGNLSMRTRG